MTSKMEIWTNKRERWSQERQVMNCNELYPAYAYLLYSVMLAEPKPDDTYKIEFRKEDNTGSGAGQDPGQFSL